MAKEIEPVVIEGTVLDSTVKHCPHLVNTMAWDFPYWTIFCHQCNTIIDTDVFRDGDPKTNNILQEKPLPPEKR